MPITEEEKQYIIEEETLRFETKRKLMQEEFNRWSMGPMGWHGYGRGCHRGFWGFKLLKLAVLGLALFGLVHLFHGHGCNWGACPAPAQSAPAPQVPAKS
ncbi:MAG TPA: hypothetical protein VMU88_07980 [bacterium]|nr:hypothetical protein [bacterium]